MLNHFTFAYSNLTRYVEERTRDEDGQISRACDRVTPFGRSTLLPGLYDT
jgi:hypothetical protein